MHPLRWACSSAFGRDWRKETCAAVSALSASAGGPYTYLSPGRDFLQVVGLSEPICISDEYGLRRRL